MVWLTSTLPLLNPEAEPPPPPPTNPDGFTPLKTAPLFKTPPLAKLMLFKDPVREPELLLGVLSRLLSPVRRPPEDITEKKSEININYLYFFY